MSLAARALCCERTPPFGARGGWGSYASAADWVAGAFSADSLTGELSKMTT
jgi:hypothetical protein